MALADYLVLQTGREAYDVHTAAWLFPELQKTKSPGTQIGNYIKALRPKVKGLPDDANAAGLRPGVINMCSACMPAEFVCAITGQDMRPVSSMYQYLDATVPMCMPGARVLSGWPQPPWGQLGRGPVPASLECLAEIGISVADLDSVIDDLFRLDSAVAPQLLKDGKLRPAVNAAFASLLMYYAERRAAGESRQVHVRLHEAMRKSGRFAHRDLTSMLCSWSSNFKSRFQADNLPLLALTEHGGMDQVASAVADLGRALLSFKAVTQGELAAMNHRCVAFCVVCVLRFALYFARVSITHSPAAALRLMDMQSYITTGAWAAATQGAPFAQREDPTPVPCASSAPGGGSGMSISVGPVQGGGSGESMGMSTPTSQGLSAYGSLIALGSGKVPPKVEQVMKKVLASEFYLTFTRKGFPTLTKQDRQRADQVINLFNAIATKDEAVTLRDKSADEGARRRIVQRLDELLRLYMTSLFQSSREYQLPTGTKKLPKSLSNALLFNSVQPLFSDLKVATGRKSFQISDSAMLSAFRRQHEAAQGVAAAAGAGAGGGGVAAAKRRRSSGL